MQRLVHKALEIQMELSTHLNNAWFWQIIRAADAFGLELLRPQSKLIVKNCMKALALQRF